MLCIASGEGEYQIQYRFPYYEREAEFKIQLVTEEEDRQEPVDQEVDGGGWVD